MHRRPSTLGCATAVTANTSASVSHFTRRRTCASESPTRAPSAVNGILPSRWSSAKIAWSWPVRTIRPLCAAVLETSGIVTR